MTIAPLDLRHQAADPTTTAATLAQLAEHWPDLRPVIAENPSAYDGLVQWLGSIDDPAVDAALRRRFGVPAVAVAQPVPMVIADAPSSGVWTEPTRTSTTPDSYLPRYRAGSALIWAGALGVLALFANPTPLYDANIPLGAVSALVTSAGFLVMPGTIGRRVIAAAVGLISVFICVSGMFNGTLLTGFGSFFWYDSSAGQAVSTMGILAAWLAVRQRPGLSYLLLAVPPIVLAVNSFALGNGNSLFLVNLYRDLVNKGLFYDDLVGGAIAFALFTLLGWSLLVTGPAWIARAIAPARSAAARRASQLPFTG